MTHKRSYCRGGRGRSVKLYLEERHENLLKDLKKRNGDSSSSESLRKLIDDWEKSKKKKR